MGTEEIQLIIIVSTLVILLMAAGFVGFFVFIQKRKNVFIREKERIRQELEKTYLTSQMEIHENTLQYIGMELHDNLGQVLSSVKIKLAMIMQQDDSNKDLSEVHQLVSSSINEVRGLSRTLNKDHFQNFGLIEAIEIELKRYKRWEIIQSHFKYNSEVVLNHDKDHLILFRILQEFFANTIRHAKAQNLWVKIEKREEKLYIEAQDDGIGIENVEMKSKGAGLLNMHRRAQMINTDIDLKSSPGNGTVIQLCYPCELNKSTLKSSGMNYIGNREILNDV